MTPTTRRAFLKSSALAAATTVAPRFAAAQSKEVLLAAVVALTGTNAAWGQRTWSAFQLGCDLINEQGGIKSMGGAKLKYIVADTESKPEVAGSQTEKVVGRGAVAITGTNQSAATIVATQIAEREGVPFVCATDVDPLITSRGFKYTFRTSPLVSAYAADLLEYVKDLGQKAGKPARTLAILSENSIVGQSSVEGATKVGKELGYEVVAGDTYDASKTQNFASYISKYKGGNVDVVIGHNKPSDAILITRTMKELNYNPMAYGGILGGHVSTEYVNALGRDADNVLATTSWSPDADIWPQGAGQEVPRPLQGAGRLHQRGRLHRDRGAVGRARAGGQRRPQEAARRHRGHPAQDRREDVHAAPGGQVHGQRRERAGRRPRVRGARQDLGHGGAEGVRQDPGPVPEAQVGGVAPPAQGRGSSTGM